MTSFRRTTVLTWILVSGMIATACDSVDLLNPERSGDAFATLVTPPGVDVAGALLSLQGVDEVILSDGEVIARRFGTELRVVILLDQPGILDFGVRLRPGTTDVAGVVLDVIDGENVAVESLGGFNLEFAR